MRSPDPKKSNRDRSAAASRQSTVTVLDVGTSKVTCFIAKGTKSSGRNRAPIRVVGVGHQVSNGIRKGAVVEMAPVETAIRAAVEGAERIANTVVKDVVLNLSAGNPASSLVNAHMAIGGRAITESDVAHILSEARRQHSPENETVIHAIPSAYTIDGHGAIRDPREMHGEKLGVHMHIVTASRAQLQNLALCVERCHLELAGVVVSPYASGLACMVQDEAELGAICVDMGGGTTSFSIFHQGVCLHSEVVPYGGENITNDIARGLSVSIASAERLKTLYGSALSSPTDHQEGLEVIQLGEDSQSCANQIPRSLLTSIIRPRLEEIFELVRDRLRICGMDSIVGKRMVLTGGASQLNGAREFAARILEKNVRLGRPMRLAGVPDTMTSPAFSVVSGLLEYAFNAPSEAILIGSNEKTGFEHSEGQVTGLKRWFSFAS